MWVTLERLKDGDSHILIEGGDKELFKWANQEEETVGGKISSRLGEKSTA